MNTIFSKNFLQGTRVAGFKNQNKEFGFFIFFIRGTYLLVYGSQNVVFDEVETNRVITNQGKEDLISYLSVDSNSPAKMELMNGFTLDDLNKIESQSVINGLFGLSSGWNSVKIKLGTLPNGYIEPEEVTTFGNAQYENLLAYSAYLSQLLKNNGIAHKGIPQ